MRLAKVLSALGRTCITAGVLILLFVVYQLWGTGIREAQAQDALEREFNQKVAQANGADGATVGSSSSTTSTSSGTATTETLPVTTAPALAAPPEGEALGKIEIPKIGLSAFVIEGVSDSDLHNGPGHYPATPLPGQQGNAAIAGHRTTYGAPFASIDELVPGDTITVTTLQGTFTYAVTRQEDGSGHIIVPPSAVEVLNEVPGKNLLTLTACHPKYSASKRIIVVGELQGEPKPALPRAADVPKPDLQGLSGKGAPKLPAILYGLLCAAIWIAAWRIGKLWRKWPSYLIGLPIFLVALFFFFENFSRLLPSNY
ncbi:MAG: sortase [Acidimicrobiaceae bacterium]